MRMVNETLSAIIGDYLKLVLSEKLQSVSQSLR